MRSSFSQYIEEMRLAIMLLTRLPVGQLREPIPSLADARWAFPFVGVAVGGTGWAAQHGALAIGLEAMPAAFLSLGAMAFLTGGLHHDGMADFADGIGGGRDRAHCLEIMRDSRIGSYGALTLIFMIALTASALSNFGHGAPFFLFLFIAVSSRLAMLAVLDLLPPARDDGLGRHAHRKGPNAWIPGSIVLISIGLLAEQALWASLIGVAVAAFFISALAFKRIGGQTGDVLGAVQLTSECSGWLIAAALLKGSAG